MLRATFIYYIRIALITAMLWPLYSQSQEVGLDIPDFPLFLTETGLPPNLLLTLDDSGSMARAYTPDLCGTGNFNCSTLDNRYTKSSTKNPMYYNPSIIYTAPPKADGTSFSTSFTSAHINGYDPDQRYFDSYYTSGNPNLSNRYRPTSQRFFVPNGPNGNPYGEADHGFMSHYSSDVDCRDTSGINRCQISNGAGGWTSNTGTQICSSDSECITRGVPAYYYVFRSTCDPNNNSDLSNNSCYTIKVVGAQNGPADMDGDDDIDGDDERQNFANWYSFYRTRNLATIAAASRAFATLEDNEARVAWQALNTCRVSGIPNFVVSDCRGWPSTWPSGVSNFSNAIKPFSGTHKQNFYRWLQRLPSNQGTPLRSAVYRAGSYFSTSGDGSPYDNDLLNSGGEQYSCRKNYHIAMTDGMWNQDSGTISVGDTEPDARRPYQDSNSNSVADIAYHFWATDLVSSLENNVSPKIVNRYENDATQQFWDAQNNPQTQQHMVNFTIGFGLSGFLANTSLPVDSRLQYDATAPEPTFAGSYSQLLVGGKVWPSTSADALGNVADLWHAALNSRGKFYSADSPDQIVAAFEDIMNTISAEAAVGGGAGLGSNTTQTTQEGATAFEARFNEDWSGLLYARPVLPDGNFADYNYWEAGERILPAPLRNIFTRNGSGGSFEAFASCTGALATALNQDANETVDNRCEQRLAWLRGYNAAITSASWVDTPSDPNDTVTFNTQPAHGLVVGDTVRITGVVPATYNGNYTVATVTTNSFTAILNTDPGTYDADESFGKVWKRYPNVFRDRVSALGDIMNSDPAYAHQESFGYDTATAVIGNDSYRYYVDNIKAGRTPVVYVGANDGMLHAFNGNTDGDGAGVELFAYVPAGVYGNLSALTATDYTATHKYFVDGPPTVGDAYISGGWKTYLVGGLGAGGKSIYALDVSNPDNFQLTDVKWEFTDTDLGFTFGKPQIAPISATQWAAIFGNGYDSSSNSAVLYIVNLSSGALIARIPTPVDNALSDTPNGLSTPYLYDSDGDQIVDVIYAGDLQGNLWKFINNSGIWSIGNDNDPLFRARNSDGDVQSITTQPTVVVDDDNRLMIYFGTGRYLEIDDLTNDEVQSFYGIWDQSTTEPGIVPRSDLLQQEITTTGSSRTVTTESFDLETHRGCYLDLPATLHQPSERIIATTLVKMFSTIQDRLLVTTATPNSDPCGKGGTSWFMELNLSCGRLEQSPFDLDQNGLPDVENVSGIQLNPAGGIFGEPLWLENPSNNPSEEGGEPTRSAYKIFTGTSGTTQKVDNFIEPINEEEEGEPTRRRIYWEQIQ